MVTRTYCPKQLKDPQTKHQFTRGHENFCNPKQLKEPTRHKWCRNSLETKHKGNQNHTSETDAETSQNTRDSTGHDKKHHGHESLKANCRYRQRRALKSRTTTVLELWCTQYLYTALGRRSAQCAHGTTTNSRNRQRRYAQFTHNECLGIVECHPVFVYRPGPAVRPQCPRHYHNRRRSSDSVQHPPCR